MGNLVVVRENAAKFSLFKKKKTLLLTKRVGIHIGFAHVSIITAVVTGIFVGATLSFNFHFTLTLC